MDNFSTKIKIYRNWSSVNTDETTVDIIIYMYAIVIIEKETLNMLAG